MFLNTILTYCTFKSLHFLHFQHFPQTLHLTSENNDCVVVLCKKTKINRDEKAHCDKKKKKDWEHVSAEAFQSNRWS